MLSNEEISDSELRERVRALLRQHWVDISPSGGYTAPNPQHYPWQWLWDSCFHSLIWAELGDERGLDELSQALEDAYASGCVPHMRYQLNPRHHEDLWRRTGASSLTGPPMYGHAIAELIRRGAHVPERLVAQAAAALEFLLTKRRRHHTSGLIYLCHPWESGADDDPRWDDFCPGGATGERWKEHKNSLVDAIERDTAGAPLFNPRFQAASAGFSALAAFNALELAEAAPGALEPDGARRLADAVCHRWDSDLRTYVDPAPDDEAPPDAGGVLAKNPYGSRGTRTAYGLLPVLVEKDAERLKLTAGELLSDRAFGGEFGPTGVHRAEDSFAPRKYWRGASWPQMNYLLWLALRRAEDAATDAADELAAGCRAGAVASGLAECWDSDDGTAVGVVPQSWAGLVLLMPGEQTG